MLPFEVIAMTTVQKIAEWIKILFGLFLHGILMLAFSLMTVPLYYATIAPFLSVGATAHFWFAALTTVVLYVAVLAIIIVMNMAQEEEIYELSQKWQKQLKG